MWEEYTQKSFHTNQWEIIFLSYQNPNDITEFTHIQF